MLSRCLHAIPIKKVVLKNYKLVFNQLADIVSEEGEIVLGAIYVISKQELEQIDRLEGYPDFYDRIIVEVEDEVGNKYDVFTYTMVEKAVELPPENYYNILLKGYEDWDLPIEPLKEARNIE
jgi:gamma-glutamylcyclotransferase (GGCT)/AIG2-like uncharacterized protein YtfP